MYIQSLQLIGPTTWDFAGDDTVVAVDELDDVDDADVDDVDVDEVDAVEVGGDESDKEAVCVVELVCLISFFTLISS